VIPLERSAMAGWLAGLRKRIRRSVALARLMSFVDVRSPDSIVTLRERCMAKDSFSCIALAQDLSHGGQVANI
jgi:hypothetical protein